MDPALLAIAQASLELTVLHAKLVERAREAATSRSEREAIALERPVIVQTGRALERLCAAIQAGEETFPLPSDETIAALGAASKRLASAVASDASTAELIDRALALVALVARVEPAEP